MWVKRRALRDGDACIKIQQVSILQLCDPIDKLWALTSQAPAARVVGPQRSVMVSMEAKVAIVKALKGAVDPRTGSISCPHISGFVECGSITQTILAWHLATDLLVFELGNLAASDDQKVATMLARYCMYLVANMPELLVDDKAWASDVYQDMKDYIGKLPLPCCVMTGNTSRRRSMELMVAKNAGDIDEKTTKLGMEVFDELKKRAQVQGGDAAVWKILADFWTKLLIFMAPSENVQGHAKTLATSGGELITYLWAFCTHAGISRQHQDIGGQQV